MKKLVVIAAVSFLGMSSLAHAATSTGNLSVSAIVIATCQVQNTAVNTARAASQVGVSCDNSTPYTISVDTTSNSGATRTYALYQGDSNQTGVPVLSNDSAVVGITLSY